MLDTGVGTFGSPYIHACWRRHIAGALLQLILKFILLHATPGAAEVGMPGIIAIYSCEGGPAVNDLQSRTLHHRWQWLQPRQKTNVTYPIPALLDCRLGIAT